MAKKTCPACGAPVSPGEDFCSYCGAVLPRNEAASSAAAAAAVQSAPAAEAEQPKRRVQTPQTIDELLAFCERHELPLAKMRFFIGLDYPGAKAYGIYQDKNGDFVVYKNKADGSRAVRYRGPDEAHAVGELFAKLKEEATSQRSRVAAARTGSSSGAGQSGLFSASSGETSSLRSGKRKPNALLIGVIALAAAITIGRTVAAVNKPNTPAAGYYQYNGNTYYSQNDDWYLYDSYGGWYPIYTVDDELQSNPGNYYTSYSYDEDYGVESFADSSYYSTDYDYDNDSGSSFFSWDWDDDDDWDSSDDWDWDSDWDSDWGDWDSDW